MKKAIISILMCVLFLSGIPISALADSGAVTYRDDALMITITLPEGWTNVPYTEDSMNKAVFSKDSSAKGTVFYYSVYDLYTNADRSLQLKAARNEINNSTVTVEQFTQVINSALGGSGEISNINVSTAVVNEKSFFKVSYNRTNRYITNAKCLAYCHIYDGYLTMYEYGTADDSINEAEAESIVGNIVFENENEPNEIMTDSQRKTKNILKIVGKTLARLAVVGVIVLIVFLIKNNFGKKEETPVGLDS